MQGKGGLDGRLLQGASRGGLVSGSAFNASLRSLNYI